MNTFETLTQAGLSKKEAAIYSALFENGVLSLSDISKHTHINRPALYQLLPALQNKGYISQVQKQRRTFYKAESPERILEAHRKNQADTQTLLTALTEQFEQGQGERPTIKYFEGEKGVRFIFDDIAYTLPKGSTFYRYTSHTGDGKPYESTHYAKVRDTKQLERLVITSEEKAKRKIPKLERSVRSIPKDFDLFADNISLVIYGQKIAYVDYSSKTTFIVESEKIARFQEKLFKLLWKKL